MANRHFGKFSEIWKHGVLAEVLAGERPERFADTHAGSADYALTHSPERDYGVFRFLAEGAGDNTLRSSAYQRVLNSLPGSDGHPARCPGSPVVAMRTLRDRANYDFFDTDPESVETVEGAARDLNLLSRVRAEVRDGCSGVLDAFRERPDGCVHIDPFDPFTPGTPGGPSPVKLAQMLCRAGTIVIYWYGYEKHAERFWAWDEIVLGTGTSATWWIGDFSYPEPETESSIVGCGVLVGNASASSSARCSAFGQELERVYRDARLPSGNQGSVSFGLRASD